MSVVARYRGPRIRATKSTEQYPYMQYPYQNVGTQLTWRDRPPYQSHGADGRSLGGYLPVPGGPEQIPIESGYSGYIEIKGMSGCGCGCGGKGPCESTGIGAIPVVDDIANMLSPVLGTAATPVVIGGLGLAAFFLVKKYLR